MAIKTFDARANGYTRGEGAGVIILQRYEDALCEEHEALALVDGTALNQHGKSNGLTAPNGKAQEKVKKALEDARLDSTITDNLAVKEVNKKQI